MTVIISVLRVGIEQVSTKITVQSTGNFSILKQTHNTITELKSSDQIGDPIKGSSVYVQNGNRSKPKVKINAAHIFMLHILSLSSTLSRSI